MFNEEKVRRTSVSAIVLYALLGLAFFTLLFSFAIVKQGEVGVVTRFGRATGREMGAGLNWKLPIAEGVTRMNTRIQRVDATAEAGTRDLQIVNSAVVLNYHINPEDASEIFGQLGDDDMLFDRVIYPAIQEVVKATFSQYKAEELLTKRDEIKGIIDDKLEERLVGYWVHIDDISLTDITFSPEFDQAIEAKQIAEQEAQKTRYEVETAKAEAEKNKAQTQQLTPEILQKMWLEKWDGKLPQVIGGDGSQYIYNLSK
jgi:regulator of protease activity HflC (stomatin/prohibitin superfamily)